MIILLSYLINLRSYPDSVGSEYIMIRWEKPESMDYEVDSIKIKSSFWGYITDPSGWANRLRPPFPDSFKAKTYFYDGIYYYYSLFLFFDATCVLETTKCISPAPPWVYACYPYGVYTGDTLLMLSTRYSSIRGRKENGIELFSYHKGDTFSDYKVHFYRWEYSVGAPTDTINKYYFYVVPHPRSLDTVVVCFISDSLRNRAGWPLDGNLNRIKEGSPEDDYVFSFFSALKGDYTKDGVIDLDDFSVFASLWQKRGNVFRKELAPYKGEIPYILVYPDSVVDFEDFSAFVLLWRWSRRTYIKKETPEEPVKMKGDTLYVRGEIRSIAVDGVRDVEWRMSGLSFEDGEYHALAFSEPVRINGPVCVIHGYVKAIEWVDSEFCKHTGYPFYTFIVNDLSSLPFKMELFDVSGRKVKEPSSPGLYLFRSNEAKGKIIFIR